MKEGGRGGSRKRAIIETLFPVVLLHLVLLQLLARLDVLVVVTGPVGKGLVAEEDDVGADVIEEVLRVRDHEQDV